MDGNTEKSRMKVREAILRGDCFCCGFNLLSKTRFEEIVDVLLGEGAYSSTIEGYLRNGKSSYLYSGVISIREDGTLNVRLYSPHDGYIFGRMNSSTRPAVPYKNNEVLLLSKRITFPRIKNRYLSIKISE